MKGNKTHGLSKHPIYAVWSGMKARCYDKNCFVYQFYGAKGITICKEWLESFLTFYNWAIANGWEKGLSIERISVYKGYYPENCKWIPRNEQNWNKTDSSYLTIDGKTLCVSQWAKIYGIETNTIYQRIESGWPLLDAVIRPVRVRKMNPTITHNGITKTLVEWSKELGIGRETIKYRAKMGWDITKRLRKPKLLIKK